MLRFPTLILTAAFALGATAPAWADGHEKAVTDLSGAPADAIQMGDITAALAVPRGTRIEPSAPPTVRLPIFFEFNSTVLRPDAEELLDKVGAALASNDLAEFRFSVEGHTDSVGGTGYNESLSQQRAAAVKAYLVASGVSKSRLQTIGHGEMTPVASNESDSGRKRNRRVELINLGSPQ